MSSCSWTLSMFHSLAPASSLSPCHKEMAPTILLAESISAALPPQILSPLALCKALYNLFQAGYLFSEATCICDFGTFPGNHNVWNPVNPQRAPLATTSAGHLCSLQARPGCRLGRPKRARSPSAPLKSRFEQPVGDYHI